KSNHLISLSEKGSSSTSNHGSNKASLQLDLDPVKCKDTATTTIPLVDGHYSEDGDGQIATTESVTTQHINGKNLQKTSKINGDQDSQNDNAVMKVSLNIEVQFPKGFPNRTEVRATSKGKQELAVNVSAVVVE
ncbi:hypothetical protein L195_g041887, partial [Trifolium pratense]